MLIDPEALRSANYHVAVLDALYRLGAGIDTNDSNLLTTAFRADAVVDFSPCGRKMGLDFGMLNGAETILHFLAASAKTQITSHMITNGRVQLTGQEAKLQALVDATHLLRRDPSERCQMRNWYRAELVEEDDLWRIRQLSIDNIWYTGSAHVLLGK